MGGGGPKARRRRPIQSGDTLPDGRRGGGHSRSRGHRTLRRVSRGHEENDTEPRENHDPREKEYEDDWRDDYTDRLGTRGHDDQLFSCI